MTTLTLSQARLVIDSALAHSKQLGYRPMAVVVLDGSGQLKALAREDGATEFRIDIATAKAWASVSMGASSRVLGTRAKDNPNFYAALTAIAQGRFVAQTGALLIKDLDGRVLGAVGASGGTGDEDEVIIQHGIDAAGLVSG